MNSELTQNINNSSAHRISRQSNADFILDNPDLFSDLLHIAFDFEDKNHHKACWVMELVLEKEPELLAPHLNFFFNNLNKFTHEGAFRSISKIVLFMVRHHFELKKQNIAFLSEKQLQSIAEVGFDRILNPKTKVAPMAYLIRALDLVGEEIPWIHPELKIILEQDYSKYSAGYKAVAREILKKLK